MNKVPKVTVLIPVFNGEKYLKECLDSMLTQTFTDLECLLIDDGSRTIDFDAAQVVNSGNATSGIPVSLPPLSAYVFALQ